MTPLPGPPDPRKPRHPPSSRRALLRAGAWSTPALVVGATAAPAAASSGNVLTIDPAGTFAAKQALLTNADYSTDGAWQVEWSGARVTLTGPGRVQPGQLTLSVNWVPDAAYTSQTSLFVGQIPAGFSADRAPGPAYSSVTYAYLQSVAPGGSVLLPDGPWFGTSQPNNLQQGTFVITAAAPGFDPGVWSVHMPSTSARLSMYLGAATQTAALPTQTVIAFVGAQWYLNGPSVRKPGDGGAGMQVRTWFVPDTGIQHKQLVSYTPVGWNSFSPTGALVDVQYWQFAGALGGFLIGGPQLNGNWLPTAKPLAEQRGTYVMLTTAPGYDPVIARLRTPPG